MYVTDIEVNDGRKSTFFNLIKLTLRVYLLLKTHLPFYSNNLDIWHSLSDITHIKGTGPGLKSLKNL